MEEGFRGLFGKLRRQSRDVVWGSSQERNGIAIVLITNIEFGSRTFLVKKSREMCMYRHRILKLES